MSGRSCWICRVGTADSREHKFKAADLRRFFGRGQWSSSNLPVHGTGEETEPVRGPAARSLTFEPVICTTCNNRVSQPWDRAYDEFVAWYVANKETLLRSRRIDFADVYQDRWEASQL